MKRTYKILALTLAALALVNSPVATQAYAADRMHQANGQFDFSITVKTSPTVYMFTRTPYYFWTRKKMTGTCSAYRWEQDTPYSRARIGSAKLTNGQGHGWITWKWNSNSDSPVMNLEVYCRVGKLYGSGYQIITGAYGED